MAKLVDLLAKHLKEWPEGAEYARQNRSESSPEYMRTYFYGACGYDFDFDLNELAEDEPHTRVTKSQYIAARDRLHAETVKEMRETTNAYADQALWDKVAIACYAQIAHKGIGIQHAAAKSFDYADAFMAERAKRLKGGV